MKKDLKTRTENARLTFLLSMEVPRLILDFELFIMSIPKLLSQPKGDGHPVLILPGFLAGDWSTIPLRLILSRLNYKPFAWEQGMNLGFSFELGSGLYRHLYEIFEKHGPITGIGWSLGGTIIKALSMLYPDCFRRIITLGSPYHIPHNTNIFKLYKLIAGDPTKKFSSFIERIKADPLIPTTAIYSTTDCLLPSEACLLPKSKYFEAINFPYACHCGMGHNTFIILKILELLRRKDDLLKTPIEAPKSNFSFSLEDLFKKDFF